MVKNPDTESVNTHLVHNNKLSTFAEKVGKDLLVQWGFEFSIFRTKSNILNELKKLGEKFPTFISYRGKKGIIFWFGYSTAKKINKIVFDLYNELSNENSLPVIIVFMNVDERHHIKERVYLSIGDVNEGVFELDNKGIIEFGNKLSKFTKPELLKAIN